MKGTELPELKKTEIERSLMGFAWFFLSDDLTNAPKDTAGNSVRMTQKALADLHQARSCSAETTAGANGFFRSIAVRYPDT